MKEPRAAERHRAAPSFLLVNASFLAPQEKKGFIMKHTFKRIIIGGFLLLLSITSAGSVLAAGLTDDEIYWLTYMREEEKLARDVYLFLYDTWGSPIFSKISKSEQTHIAAIKTLLDRFGIPDLAAGKAAGEFSNPDLQALYDDLTEQGKRSLVEALKVGVLIEETDIDDLNEAMASTNRKAIKTVYGNLLQGSLNHLKAFVSRLAKLGVVYEP
jgi:hypothetical protein